MCLKREDNYINPFNLLEVLDNRINVITILIQGTLSLKI